jgi:cytochrome c oxidase subunit II
MIQAWAAAIFVVLGLLLAGVFVFIAVRARAGPVPYDEVAHTGYQIRAFWFLGLAAALAVVLTLGIPFYPYPLFRQSTVGQPEVQVQVTASQYLWTLEPNQVPAGRVIEFNVTSSDVNHDFALYGPDNALAGQVQAMPGYSNRLYLKFSRPGSYEIRCLEYCGVAHSGMVGRLSVTP